MGNETTRRALLGGAGLAGVAIAAPAVAALPSSGCAKFRAIMDANDAAIRRFCTLPRDLESDDPDSFEREEDRMIDAHRTVADAVPTDWPEFFRLMDYRCGELQPSVAAELRAHARRLLSKGA